MVSALRLLRLPSLPTGILLAARFKTYRSFNSYFPMLAPTNSVLVWEEDADPKKKNGQRYISLLISCQHNGSSLNVALRRQTTEDFDVTAAKIQQKLLQGLCLEKGKPPQDDVDFSISSVLSSQEKSLKAVIDENEALLVGGRPFTLEKEPADCLSITVPLVPVVGCPSIPVVDMRTESPVTIHWFVQTPPSAPEPPQNGKKKSKKEKPLAVPEAIFMEGGTDRRFSIPGCDFRATGALYMPTAADVGKRLVVLADPGPKSVVRCGVSKHVVSPIEEGLICQERLDWCQKNPIAEGSRRLVTFNLLADLYLNLGLPQEELFFPYCPKEYQHYDYRYPLILREIKGYNSDICCLQEVDARMQMRFLSPIFREMGMEMAFAKKRKEVNEGTVIAYKKERFSLISSESFWLSELLQNKENEDLLSLLKTGPKSLEIFSGRPTIVQIVVLEDKDRKSAILCANTHLHHDPKHEHIKAAQALVALRQIHRLRQELQSQYERVHVLFGGDFNSTPDGPVYRLFTEGTLPKDDSCWKLDSDLLPIDLQVTTNREKYENLTGFPNFTNYTRHPTATGEGGFVGVLDYIFASGGVEVERTAPGISLDEARKHIALPSRASPSDHIALIVDVKLQ